MKISVKLFASFREAFGSSEVQMELPDGTTAGDMLEDIFQKHPQLERFRGHAVVTIAKHSVPLSQSLHDGDEVAILPPVSGG